MIRKTLLTLTAVASLITAAQADDASLRKQIVGYWSSGRHIYEYRADGTWWMCPAEAGTTHGHWAVENGQFFSALEGGRLESEGTVEISGNKLNIGGEELFRSKNSEDFTYPKERREAHDRSVIAYGLVSADAELNTIWQSLPPATREQLKAEQRQWIKVKDQASPELRLQLTNDRLAYLKGFLPATNQQPTVADPIEK
jgi:hypothetical protein